MELRVLNYFLTAAREQNITKAAGLLHITQPTLSRQLMQLEDELGVTLFRRSNHSIILTEDGLLLKRRAEELLSLAEKTKQEFRQEEQLGGEIAIGCGEYQSTKLLSEIIADFRAAHPLVQFHIHSGNSDNIREQIDRGCLDLGLLLEPVDFSKYDSLRLPVTEEYGAWVREDGELASKEAIEPKDLIGIPLVCGNREVIQNKLKSWFGSSSDEIEFAATGNLPYNLAALASSGIGPFITLKLNCRYDGVRYIPLTPALTTRTVLVWKISQPNSRTVNAFISHTKEYLAGISNDL